MKRCLLCLIVPSTFLFSTSAEAWPASLPPPLPKFVVLALSRPWPKGGPVPRTKSEHEAQVSEHQVQRVAHVVEVSTLIEPHSRVAHCLQMDVSPGRRA